MIMLDHIYLICDTIGILLAIPSACLMYWSDRFHNRMLTVFWIGFLLLWVSWTVDIIRYAFTSVR